MHASTKKTSGNKQNSPEKISPKKKSLLSFIGERNETKSKSVQADVIICKRQYLEKNNSPENSDPLLFWKVTCYLKCLLF